MNSSPLPAPSPTRCVDGKWQVYPLCSDLVYFAALCCLFVQILFGFAAQAFCFTFQTASGTKSQPVSVLPGQRRLCERPWKPVNSLCKHYHNQLSGASLGMHHSGNKSEKKKKIKNLQLSKAMILKVWRKWKLSHVRLFATLWAVCSPPGSPVHGILQARTLEKVAIPSSRGSSQPGDQTQLACIAGRFFTIWATQGNDLS